MKKFAIRIESGLPKYCVVDDHVFSNLPGLFLAVCETPLHVADAAIAAVKSELGYEHGWNDLVGRESNRALHNHSFWRSKDEVRIALERIRNAFQVGEETAKKCLLKSCRMATMRLRSRLSDARIADKQNSKKDPTTAT